MTQQGAGGGHSGVSGAVSAQCRGTGCRTAFAGDRRNGYGPALSEPASQSGRAGAGEHVSSAGSNAVDGYEPVGVPSRPAAARGETAMFRRRSAQPSRRAVLHVQAAGDPPVPPDVASWYTERAFHFYLTGLRLPSLAPVGARPTARYLGAAFADLDAARAHLREADGMVSIIITASGRGAIAAALWQDGRASAADAMILHDPLLPPGVTLSLDIGCPVLVLAGQGGQAVGPRGRGWPGRRQRKPGRPDHGGLQLGGHVTWLRLPAGGAGLPGGAAGPPGGAEDAPGGARRSQFFDELGRWLGAYMYGQVRDHLL
jgi:hypothetical protein